MKPFADPVYVESGRDQLFGLYEAPAAATGGTAVLLCAPWGWEETSSYRLRRAIAHRFSEAGHPTLRFDLPGVGDSTGSPGDADLVDSWVAAVVDASRWLRGRSGCGRVAALGLGFGGTLAMAALDRGAEIEELILWATPPTGRRFLREVKTFAKLQARSGASGSQDALPPGWVEAGGFVLSAETVASLEALEPIAARPAGLERALLLGRDGIAVDSRLEDLMRGVADVQTGSGAGWGDMVVHPEDSTYPAATIERMAAWLGRSGASSEPCGSTADLSAGPELAMTIGGRRVVERPFAIAGSAGGGFAVSTEPDEVDERAEDLCVVYLNTGAVRHIGPHRTWVEDARRWGGRGVRGVRIDLDGIGEAAGERSHFLGVSGFYAAHYGDALRDALDALEARGLGRRFICVGLCSGAYWGLQMADRDPRVAGVVLLNAGALVWHDDLRIQREAYAWFGRPLRRASSWKKLLRLEVDFAERARVLRRGAVRRSRLIARRIADALRGVATPDRHGSEVEALLDRLRIAEKRVAMSFSEGEPVLREMRRSHLLDQLERWPNISLGELPGGEHALGSIPAQRASSELVDRELELLLGPRRGGDEVSATQPIRVTETYKS